MYISIRTPVFLIIAGPMEWLDSKISVKMEGGIEG
jgi:hypothetical protein